MNKNKVLEKIFKAIKEIEKSLVFDITVDSYDDEDDDLYIELSYQIDDRVQRGYDKSIECELCDVLGDGFGASLDRVDAFPNGYAAYKLTIDK